MEHERISLKIPSARPGWNLDAWKYLPHSGEALHPVIIMAHGLSAHKVLLLDVYAERFVAEGYACIVFDYRRWGSSDGTPRNVLLIREQLEDYRTVISWVRQQKSFDPKKIILWGTSFSGGHIQQISSEDPDIAAAIGQCPFAGVSPNKSTSQRRAKLAIRALTDVIRRVLHFDPLYSPAGSAPGKGGILSAPGSLEGLTGLAREPSYVDRTINIYPDYFTRQFYRDYDNKINAGCVLQVISYKPHLTAKSIKCPLLLVVPIDDDVCSVPNAEEAVEKAEKGEIFRIEGGHFDVYPGHDGFEATVQAEIEFLKKHVSTSN